MNAPADRKKIGILGGMGPGATHALFGLIISHTLARRDQDHIRILIDNRPDIPDRSAFVLGEGPDPVPAMLESARGLEQMGADLLLIPCNTAHYFLDRIRPFLKVRILDMIRICADEIQTSWPGIRQVGLLSTLGTYATEIYQRVLQERGLEVLVPGKNDREKLMEVIYGPQGIKAGTIQPHAKEITRVGEGLIKAGAGLIISGCTELSLVLDKQAFPFPVVLPMRSLAREAVLLAGYRLRGEPQHEE
ncbi:MAG TPA: amino acid racemase [Bacteroidetes bacterium]|nr:amino acid racemase [Bacteroidota bacterium]